ncbi:MAG TPA: hypothetical protein VHT91_49520 [Kofleriaceae bacterium]|jgi:hypothetical protein|nr:hypothetical protein [Kofleriaceae bacterium]
MGLVADSHATGAAELTPPEALRWEFFLQQGVRPICTFVRRRQGSAWGPARIVVSYPGAQPALPPDPVVPWDPVLEDWLLDHRIAARDEANETARFGHALETRFGAIERRCGSATFTAVLLRCLYDLRCELYLPLERKLGAIRSYEPDPGSARTAAGAELTEVVRRSQDTLAALGYPTDRAAAIFGDALAAYLRERFEL